MPEDKKTPQLFTGMNPFGDHFRREMDALMSRFFSDPSPYFPMETAAQRTGLPSLDMRGAISPAIDFHDWWGQGLPLDEMFESQELARQPAVLLVRSAAFPRPGQGSNRHFAIDDSAHDLRRATHQNGLGCPQIEHEGTGIDDPQRTIDVKRI